VSKVRHEDYKSPTPFAAMKGIAGDVFVALETIRTNSDTINRQFLLSQISCCQERKPSTSSNLSKPVLRS
jgi:hypothetical protein